MCFKFVKLKKKKSIFYLVETNQQSMDTLQRTTERPSDHNYYQHCRHFGNSNATNEYNDDAYYALKI